MKTYRRWLVSASPDEKGEHFIRAGMPWRDPRLSPSEKYSLRYRFDPAFNDKERKRRAIRKYARNDWIGDRIRQITSTRGRSRVVEAHLGYSIDEFREHFEALFTEGMSWDAFDRGEIHIDHVLPQYAFDLTDPTQWRACWSLPNLQPLWAADNIAKGKSMPEGSGNFRYLLENFQ
ncbi:hypothetical protein T8A63_15205 [Sulfitobacter sp. OXR-159]|uniref:hypothetical protein n=1 Tax=Sulfitobacter sp. OXR-159 TaxID=3100174 RepID=UPI002AC929EA|nr:hypothetical protein [Sulfitobacter sp. OXR-159]WPZ28961.1 hypothetical protein T8A63_15205 [Sulfitobacter sp. OXR-159]